MPRSTRSGISGCADRVGVIVAGAIATTLFAASPARAQSLVGEGAPPRPDLSASLGATVWHGDYGAPTDTEIWAAIFGVRYRIGGLRLSATIPRMRISSDGTFFTGIGATPLFVAPNRPGGGRRVRQGFGDVTLGAAYVLPQTATGGFDLELAGRVKLPTASDASGLSTGQTDYSAGFDLSRTIGRVTPHASATYRVFGEGRGLKFRNGFDLVAGLAYALPGRTTLLLDYELTQRASRLIGDAHELVAGASTPLGKRFRLSGYASAGLSRGATDVSGGASVSLTL